MPVTLLRKPKKSTASRLRPTKRAASTPAPAARRAAAREEAESAEEAEEFSCSEKTFMKIEGVVTSMVRILEHFTVRDSAHRNREVKFTWTPKTRFVQKGKTTSPLTLKVGTPVTVACDLGNRCLLAQTVSIKHGRTA